MAKECGKILEEENSEYLDELFVLGGSSGGARPKILTAINNEKWIVKFSMSLDPKNAGEMEYRYALCAKQCGINIPEVALLPSKFHNGYFGIKRFDRVMEEGKEKKVHMISVDALLETSHRIPKLDYHVLMKVVKKLTNNYGEIEQLFRRMCFNVYAYNLDDHSKNFSFLFCEEERQWTLSPAYDLTYSNTLHGEHATTVNGKGINIMLEDLIEVGVQAGVAKGKAKTIAMQTEEIVKDQLHKYIHKYK